VINKLALGLRGQGGMFGYLIGLEFMDLVGHRIVEFYGFQPQFDKIGGWYNEYQAWAVAAAGFTPLPYKVFTIAAGVFEVNFLVFVLASHTNHGICHAFCPKLTQVRISLEFPSVARIFALVSRVMRRKRRSSRDGSSRHGDSLRTWTQLPRHIHPCRYR